MVAPLLTSSSGTGFGVGDEQVGAVLLGDDDGALSVHGCGGTGGLERGVGAVQRCGQALDGAGADVAGLGDVLPSQRLANLGARVGPTRAAQYLAGALR